MSFSWRCPYCKHHATITDDNYSVGDHRFSMRNKDGSLQLHSVVIVCPNRECMEYTISAELRPYHYQAGQYTFGDVLGTWSLRPASQAMTLPGYVPAPIVQDYTEACAIRGLSPKASATLSRRCLQGMIRDFFGVSKSRLVDEIEAIRDKVSPTTWESIDAVRTIGNIGAHMEKDINIIVDVEAQEAGLLIELIESLIEDWYVARDAQEKRAARIKEVAADKAAAKLAGGVKAK